MFCPNCGKEVAEGTKFCSHCGAPIQPPVQEERAAEPAAEGREFPSVMNLRCPKCDSNQLKVLGTKGSLGSAIGIGAMFGAVRAMVKSSQSKNDFELKEVKYQCLSCKEKFTSLPQVAPAEDILDEPCTVHFNRLGSAVGMAVTQQVYLNGVKMGNVKNKGELVFQTFTRHNTIFVTDQYGMAFPGTYEFIAENGGTETINFKRKFV